MKTLKKLKYLLTSAEQRRAIILIGMVLIMGLVDTLGVASIMPFMTVLTNPDMIETNFILNNLFNIAGIFGVKTYLEFTFALGISVFIILITSLCLRAITSYLQIRFILMCEYNIGKRLVENYLNQNYSWFLNRNSADLDKSILSEVGLIIGNGFKPYINLITQGVISIMIIILLIFVDFKIAITLGLIFLLIYGLIYKVLRGLLKQIGRKRLQDNKLRFTAISEAFGAIKEIKIGGLEEVYIERFAKPSKSYAWNQALTKIMSQLPSLAVQAIAFGCIILVTLFLMVKSGSFIDAIPIITLYAFAGYRLMPSFQQIYSSIALLRYAGPALDSLYSDMKKLKPLVAKYENIQEDVKFNENISLNDVNFQYPNASRISLKKINFCIPACTTVGLVGPTGSGKTTLVDIILCLLEPQNGTLKVDGKIINKKNIKSWQNLIGYVPQNIYLTDDTITANIALGVDPMNVDHKEIVRAAKNANIHEFIENELPKKYETTVGERGIRLSGGQRQRIGIARALYRRPQLLILDEATSALDNLTEKIVMEAVQNIGKDITIIIIAHRLSTVRECDKIYLLENGQIKSQGRFEELIESDKNFKIATQSLD